MTGGGIARAADSCRLAVPARVSIGSQEGGRLLCAAQPLPPSAMETAPETCAVSQMLLRDGHLPPRSTTYFGKRGTTQSSALLRV
jgi:hypothetical protein